MAFLSFVTKQPKPSVPVRPALAAIYAGCRYHVGSEELGVLNSTQGVIGDYRITAQCAEIMPVTPVTTLDGMHACSFWDTDMDLSRLRSFINNDAKNQRLPLQDCKLMGNRMLLNRQALNGPTLDVVNETTVLSLSPEFEFTFCTDAYTAQLGVIHLVNSTRFITLKNGDEISVLNTGTEQAPVLYLEDSRVDNPINFVSEQQETGVTRTYSYTCHVSQNIPAEVAGEAVDSVTVLEQYFSYFMQRAVPLDDQLNIWIPVYAPISWGWSIRVGRRFDGEWGILRRKLILPTTGHDGLQMPTWNNNSANCASPLE